MAFLWKHPKSKYWMARFIDGTGKRRNRSTRVLAKEAQRRAAQKIADSYEEAANKRRTAGQVREVIAALHEEITGEGLVNLTFSEFAAQWLIRKRAETAPATFSFYKGMVDRFTTFLKEKANAPIAEISGEDVGAFRNVLAQDRASGTVNHLLKALKMLFKAARREQVITDDPSEFVDTIRRRGGGSRRPFTLPEIRAVLSVADAEWRSLILFGLYTGLRLGDIAGLTWANVDLQGEEIRLTARKTGKQLILPIAAPLKKHLEALPAGDDPNAPLHPQAFALLTRQGQSGGLSNQFADLLAQAGLREKTPHRKTHGQGRGIRNAQPGLSFHCLRHTAISLLKEAGIPVAVVMEYVGHDSEEVNKRYTHVGDEAMKKAAAALPDLTSDERD